MNKYLENIEKLKKARSAEELYSISKEVGIGLTAEEAKTVFERLKRTYQ